LCVGVFPNVPGIPCGAFFGPHNGSHWSLSPTRYFSFEIDELVNLTSFTRYPTLGIQE
jgi:hypothetical protein